MSANFLANLDYFRMMYDILLFRKRKVVNPVYTFNVIQYLCFCMKHAMSTAFIAEKSLPVSSVQRELIFISLLPHAKVNEPGDVEIYIELPEYYRDTDQI